MTKKERLGNDPFKGSSLNWIQNTGKKDSKSLKTQNSKELKRYSARTLKREKVKGKCEVVKPDPESSLVMLILFHCKRFTENYIYYLCDNNMILYN